MPSIDYAAKRLADNPFLYELLSSNWREAAKRLVYLHTYQERAELKYPEEWDDARWMRFFLWTAWNNSSYRLSKTQLEIMKQLVNSDADLTHLSSPHHVFAAALRMRRFSLERNV